jgi:UDP-3-O-[3-hydroxymyristoyl] glucosamine N-acyltransferase
MLQTSKSANSKSGTGVKGKVGVGVKVSVGDKVRVGTWVAVGMDVLVGTDVGVSSSNFVCVAIAIGVSTGISLAEDTLLHPLTNIKTEALRNTPARHFLGNLMFIFPVPFR